MRRLMLVVAALLPAGFFSFHYSETTNYREEPADKK
jgi:hypothetical protein